MMLFPRTIELCRARWEEIDLGTAEWKVPPEKIKSRRLHIVPLPKQALGLLRELQEMMEIAGTSCRFCIATERVHT
ncbi:hypothetical protein [Burkholderia lata]|uniref:hypothetical protein n=1 Tax=Burkholderia lata (strain ATCC 17760 / DSM 23089 / LMG 22485 / NCIMB 9086 / R18194 / 383) TaxID=482957 RepID=UPI0015826D62|nr:hypothetical protein [Burkholderia lata]